MDDTCIKLTISFLRGTNSVSSIQSPRVVGVCPYWGAQPENISIISGNSMGAALLQKLSNQPRLDAWDKRSDLVHWEDLEGSGGEGGGRRDGDGEHMQTHGCFISMYDKIHYNIKNLKKIKKKFFFGCTGWRILVPWPGMEPVLLGVEVQNLKYWTSRKVP